MPRARRLAVPLVFVAGFAAATAMATIGPPGPQRTVNTVVSGFQGKPDVAAQPAGNYVVAWQSNSQIRVRRFNSADQPLTGEIIASTTATDEEIPRVSAAPDGSFVVVWESTAGGDAAAQRFEADGDKLGGQIDVIAVAGGTDGMPDVAVAPNGTFVVVWAYGSGIRARRFAANGTPAGGAVDVGDADASGEPAVAIDSLGRVMVVWSDYTDPGGLTRARMRGFSATLSPTFAAKAVIPETSESLEPDVVATDEGFAIVFGVFTASSVDLYGRRFAANGNALAAGAPLKSSGRKPHVARGPDDGLVVTWREVNSNSARAFDAALAPAGSSVEVFDAGAFPGPEVSVAAFSGAVIATYEAYVGSGSNRPDVYANRVPYDLTGGTTTTTTTTTTPTTTATTTTTTPTTAATTTTTTEPPAPPAPDAPPAPVAPGPTVAAPSRTDPAVTKTPTLGAVAVLPSSRRCVSRRKFRIRLRHPTGARIKSADVEVNGKKVATRRGARVTAPVDLRGLPKGRFTVRIKVTLVDGRKVNGSRRYRTCTPKRHRRA